MEVVVSYPRPAGNIGGDRVWLDIVLRKVQQASRLMSLYEPPSKVEAILLQTSVQKKSEQKVLLDYWSVVKTRVGGPTWGAAGIPQDWNHFPLDDELIARSATRATPRHATPRHATPRLGLGPCRSYAAWRVRSSTLVLWRPQRPQLLRKTWSVQPSSTLAAPVTEERWEIYCVRFRIVPRIVLLLWNRISTRLKALFSTSSALKISDWDFSHSSILLKLRLPVCRLKS